MNRPITTLFMLESLDGKISTGSTDNLDVDKDYPKIDGVKEGLHQYYELEKKTDYFSLNTGKVMAKIGVNSRKQYPEKIAQYTGQILLVGINYDKEQKTHQCKIEKLII